MISSNIYLCIIIINIIFNFNSFVISDFVFHDFNETTGLIFNGIAGTTNCFDDPLQRYGDVQGLADIFNENVVQERGENTDDISESATETNLEIYNVEIETEQAGFLHRKGTITAPSRCNVRARITPSNPSKAGSVWYRDEVPVSNGFETYFTFQASDHSKECTLHKDQYFSQINHRTCSVHGGDGFAFVIQQSSQQASALGEAGGQMGFGGKTNGIENSLAIAFDTWQNPGEDRLGVDHISIQSRGHLKNDGLEAGLLGVPRSHELADGAIHVARITYHGELKPEYLNYLSASDSLLPYLLDIGEQKRIGTLLVYIDEGIATDTPIIALPINLSLLLKLPDDKAFVGFTGSTGTFYEKHDILSWLWCDQQPCDAAKESDFDYHQESKHSTVGVRRFEPGAGYGGGDNSEGFPTKNKSPDTTSWEMPVEHFSSGRAHGLTSDASLQMPPGTLY
jgi:hypothetical protein